jgi:poly(hydroxyalkanoate) depolymerase family esterase
MNRFPAPDLAGALRLTQQGRLKEAIDILRGKTASGKPTDPVASPQPRKPGAFQLISDTLKSRLGEVAQPGAWQNFRRPANDTKDRFTEPQPNGSSFENLSYRNEAGSRTYKLFVPSGYRGQKIPLVLMLHGCTQSPDDFAAGTRMNVLAEAQTFLVAYPEQARSANVSKCWNWFHPTDQRRDEGEPSLIAGITRQIQRDFNVLPGAVYVAGLSAGGAAAAIMGSTYPELYAAIGVHSGLACGAASDLPSALAAMRHGGASAKCVSSERVIPTIVFHGDKDATVNVVNAGQVIAQSKGYAKLSENVSSGETGGRQYTRTTLSRGSGPAVLEEWVLHGAGHAWSGGSGAGSYTDPTGPDASREMIRFFFAQPPSAG